VTAALAPETGAVIAKTAIAVDSARSRLQVELKRVRTDLIECTLARRRVRRAVRRDSRSCPWARRRYDINQYGQPVARLVGPWYQSGQLGDPLAWAGTGVAAAAVEGSGKPKASGAMKGRGVTGMDAGPAEAAGAPQASAAMTATDAAKRLSSNMMRLLCRCGRARDPRK
jgi:hypothetical protein